MLQRGEFASQVEAEIRRIKGDNGDSVPLEDVRSLLNGLFEGAMADARNENQSLADELKELVEYIGRARGEMKALKPRTMGARDIPEANDELNAIVQATDEAATRVMDAADQIGEMAADAAGKDNDVGAKTGERLEAISTELYEASSFQDICGQRVTKVVGTLSFLEDKLIALAEAVGDHEIEAKAEDVQFDETDHAVNSDDLLNGPQLDGDGMSQSDIDALLADF